MNININNYKYCCTPHWEFVNYIDDAFYVKSKLLIQNNNYLLYVVLNDYEDSYNTILYNDNKDIINSKIEIIENEYNAIKILCIMFNLNYK